MNGRFPKVICCTTVLCGILMAGALLKKGQGGEPDRKPWTPEIGKRYHWLGPNGARWDAIDLASSPRAEKVTFLTRQAPVEPGNESFRAILFSEGKVLMPLPYNIGGRTTLEVYWYDAIGDEGPFLRLADQWGEYLVDLKQKTTAVMLRRKGLTFVGELRPGEDRIDTGYQDDGIRLQATVHGRPTSVLVGPLATEAGKKLGEIRDR